MDLREVFQKHRQLLLFAQLISGDSLQERIRNLAWVIDLLVSGEVSWQEDELIVLAQESTPFLPANEIIQEITKLRLLSFDSDTDTYNLNSYSDLHEPGLPVSITQQDCMFALADLRDLLQGGTSQRIIWTRSYLKTILHHITEFGFHCIRSWQSLVASGKELDGVPFLWNVAPDGSTTPQVDVPGSSATLDIVRLAVEPLNFMEIVPTEEQRALVQWAFDRIYRNIKSLRDGRAYYFLPADDSYPNTAHPINDTQARVINLLIHLLREDKEYLDAGRHQQARESVTGLARYLLSEQLLARGEKYHGFWSFHNYENLDLDGFQVLTINSELAVKALESLWPIADDNLKVDISRGINHVVDALRRTAIKDKESIAWQKHFSTLTTEITAESDVAAHEPGIVQNQVSSVARSRACEIFATARAMLIFATAKTMGICEDEVKYIHGALQFVMQNWVVKLKDPKDDVEFIPYRTPENAKWSDLTYRITNPISAIMPYCILKSSRLSGIRLPILLTESVNNCMDFALKNYEGHGFWRDASTGLAYPTNTAFNMEMLMEYLHACEM